MKNNKNFAIIINSIFTLIRKSFITIIIIMFSRIFLIILVTCSSCLAESNVYPEIRTPTNIIVGKQNPVQIGSNTVLVDQFTGITYGHAKRFQRPTPAWKLDTTKVKIDATRPARFCPQQSGFIEMFKSEMTAEQKQMARISENCLQLNVWVRNVTNESSFTLKPVLVWFHGGSFISDTTARLLYQGQQLAAREDIVVVTVNYRLDAFGFMYIGHQNQTLKTQTNAGIWDQLLALEWIQEHIEYFQGDSKHVTIAGFDSGATSVGLHLMSPKSRRLFQQAIMMSGSVYTQLISARSACNMNVAQMWAQMASTISCGHEWTAKTLKCLKQASIDKILQLINPFGPVSTGPEIVMDQTDDLFPFDTLSEAIDQIDTSKMVIMIGSTDDEGSQVLPMMNDKLFQQFISDQQLSWNEAIEQMVQLTSKLVPPRGCNHNKVNGDDIAKCYLSDSNVPRNFKTIGQSIGDFYVSCPMTLFAEKLIEKRQNPAQLYQYVWSQKSRPNRFAPCLEWMGACHGTDVLMMFGIPFMASNEFDENDQKISKKFMKTIGHFVHHGRPNIKKWLPWTWNETNSLHMPYSQFIDGVWKFETNWKQDQCHKVWAKYLMTNNDDNRNLTCRRESFQ
nr:acetylcholinesterase-like [Dermatophagoides farinae]